MLYTSNIRNYNCNGDPVVVKTRVKHGGDNKCDRRAQTHTVTDNIIYTHRDDGIMLGGSVDREGGRGGGGGVCGGRKETNRLIIM